MDIFLALFLGLVIFGSSFRLKGLNSDYLSVDNTKGLRGILAIIILLHHISEKIGGGVIFPFMIQMGNLVVAVFFFLSGLGLMSQFKKKGKKYLKGFLISRCLYLFLVETEFMLLYYLLNLLLGKNITFSNLLLSFINGNPVALNSWYVLELIVLYILFFGAFSIFGKNPTIAAWVVLLLQVGLCVFYKLMHFSAIWYISSFAFSAGLFWGCFEKHINEKVDRHYWLYLTAVMGIFMLFSVIPNILQHYFPAMAGLKEYCRMISTTFFAFLTALLLKKIRIKAEFWKWLGGISLEIYLVQGMAFLLLGGGFLQIENGILSATFVIVFSIIMAIPLNRINSYMHNGLKKCQIIKTKKGA